MKAPQLKPFGWGDYHWLVPVGDETVIAVRPTREEVRVVMGALGRLGVAAKAIRFQEATGAKSIVQIGMAFGLDPQKQKLGDVLVSSFLIPYDNRIVTTAAGDAEQYVTDYSPAAKQPARAALVDLFSREQKRGGHPHAVHVGAILSGAARIGSRVFRDELARGVPESDPIVGGEMEGVGLLAASSAAENPIWCVVKGISDFADEYRVIDENRRLACRHSAEFVLSALVNDAKGQ